MIISSHEIQLVLRQYGVNRVSPPAEKPVEAGKKAEEKATDRAELSQEAALYRRVREAAAQAPEVRENRIREIKRALERGEYAVPAGQVAEKLLGTSLADHLLEDRGSDR